MNRPWRWAWLAAALLAGCVSHTTGTETREALGPERVAKIERAQTTRRQILEWFGVPDRIARKAAFTGSESDATQDAFAAFAARGPVDDDSIIYYYGKLTDRRMATDVTLVLPAPVPQPWSPCGPWPCVGGNLSHYEGHEQRDLWILLDERTGLVRDYLEGHIER